MNRHRRKAVKIAKRHKRGLWAPATNPFWRMHPAQAAFMAEETAPHVLWAGGRPPQIDPAKARLLMDSMRALYNRCSAGTSLPEHAIVSGELVNLALETTDHDPDAAYSVGPNGIERLTKD